MTTTPQQPCGCAFPVVKSGLEALNGGAVVIWTTTPWTLPGNRAIAFGADMDYVIVNVTEAGEESLAKSGELFTVASELLETNPPGCGDHRS